MLESTALAPEGNTLPTAVANRMRELITEGKLAAGTHLNERMLCDSLGVSRTPLREALRLLAADGLVRIEPNRGAQVVVLSVEDIRESFELIGALEAISGELACRRATDQEIAEIRALTFEMMAAHARQDLPAYYRCNREIHSRISQACHNGLLTRIYETQNLRIQSLRFGTNQNREKWDQAMSEHLEMMEALFARDGPRLAAIMHGHMQSKCETALKSYPQSTCANPHGPEEPLHG
jgi:DNA-binding GntR family transcriptional regulator